MRDSLFILDALHRLDAKEQPELPPQLDDANADVRRDAYTTRCASGELRPYPLVRHNGARAR